MRFPHFLHFLHLAANLFTWNPTTWKKLGLSLPRNHMLSPAHMPQLLQWVHRPRFLPRRLPPRSTAILRRCCRCSSWREACQVLGRSCSCVVVSSFRSDHLWVNICFSYTSLTTQCHGQFHSVAMGLQCSTTPIVTNVGMCFLQLLLLLLMCQLLLLLLLLVCL